MCNKYGCRPSAAIGIDNEITALDFDYTVMYLANKKKSENEANIQENPRDEMARLESEFNQVKLLQQQAGGV